MIQHLLSHWLSRKVEKRVDGWVNSGQQPDRAVAMDGERVRMAFSLRYRLHMIALCIGFGSVFALTCWLCAVAPGKDIGAASLCLGILGLLFLFSAMLALHSLTAQVIISPQRLIVRAFFIDYASTDWDNVRSAYRSPVHASIVLVTSSGRRIRISTKLDGLHAMIAPLGRLKAGSIDRSIADWIISGEPREHA
jgi:hypothetical protein